MANNTTLDFLNFNNPPSDDNFQSNTSGGSRNTNAPQSNNFNPLSDDPGKKMTYLDSVQKYFNIDTNMFLNRLYCSVFPFKKPNFICDVLESNPDIYGPLWILLTLVLCIGVTNSLVHFFNTYGEQSAEVDFGMVSAVFTLLSMYISLVPLGLYFYMSYNKASTNYTYMEILCTYGYNLTILIPISILYHLNFSFWRLSLVIIGVIITFTILYGTFWPAFKNLGKKNESTMVMLLILILQFAVITLLKVYYLDTLSAIKIPNDNLQVNYPHTEASNLVKGISIGENTTLKNNNISDIINPTTIHQTIKESVKLISNTTTSFLNSNTTSSDKILNTKGMVNTTIKNVSNSIITTVPSLISNVTRN